MIRFSAILLVLPLFAVACGSSPDASSNDEVNSARQALEQGETDSPSEQVETLEVEEAAPVALVAADAGAPAPEAPAPEAAPEAPVADEGDAAPEEEPAADEGDAAPEEEPAAPVVEETPVEPEPPVPCTENDTRRMDPPNDHLIETCFTGEWTVCLASTCPFSPFWDPNGPVPMQR